MSCSDEADYAIFSGDLEKLRALKEAGGDEFVKQRSVKEGWNHLHMALLAIADDDLTPIAAIKYLLEIGVDVNAADCYGNTPLHYAARAKYVEAMELLLDYGAAKDVPNIDTVTPLRQTLLSLPFSHAATELLLARGATPDPATLMFVREISHGTDKVIGELFDKHAKGKGRDG